MTDLELTRLCAAAMGLSYEEFGAGDKAELMIPRWPTATAHVMRYDPLHDDAQVMALVKKLGLQISYYRTANKPDWRAVSNDGLHSVHHKNLNRAICVCAAETQARRGAK